MKVSGLVLLFTLSVPFRALAGPNAGGALIVHNTGLNYAPRSESIQRCVQNTVLKNCRLANGAHKFLSAGWPAPGSNGYLPCPRAGDGLGHDNGGGQSGPIFGGGESEPQPQKIFGYAYGHALAGVPVLTFANDTVYVNGYAYSPHRVPQHQSSPPDTSEFVQAHQSYRIMDQASASAESATSAADYVSRYAAVLEAYKGRGVAQYTVSESEVRVLFDLTFRGKPISVVRELPRRFPHPSGVSPRTEQSALKDAEDGLQECRNAGAWLCWGWNEEHYEFSLPRSDQQRTLRAIDRLHHLIAEGLPEPALADSIGALDLSDTALLWKPFLRDLIAAGKGE